VIAMTQKRAEERLRRLGLSGIALLTALFAIIVIHQLRQQRPIPPPVTLPKEPATLMLLVTANRQGKLEVCGCPGKRAEDLTRVAALLKTTIDQHRRRGTQIALIEGGDFLGEPDATPYLLRAYQAMGYQVIALSPRDAKHLSQIRAHANGLPLLPPQRDGDKPDAFSLRLGEWKVVLVNLGEPPSVTEERAWQPIATALRSLRHPHTLLVALAYTDRKTADSLAQRLNGLVDVLLVDDNVTDGSILTADGTQAAGRQVGKILLASLPQFRSQVLSVMLWANGKQSAPKLEAMALSSYGQSPDPKVKEIVDAYYTMRQKKLQREMQRLLAVAQKRDYVTPEFCGSCHRAQYDQWLTTRHAQAIMTLKERNRMDKQCLTCHSLEFKMRGVVTVLKNRGVECVDCHTELADPMMARMHGQRPGERPTTKNVTEQICVRCHDRENSPKFDYRTYLPKVTH
jgi:hypothetical protein